MSSAREHLEQVAYFQLVDLHLHLHPELVLFFAIPNGGARHPAVAGKLKAEGVKPGVPDVMGAVPRDPFAGLFLEFKIRPNGPTRPQRRWHEELRAQGYRVEVVYSSVEAWEVTADYLGIGRPRVRPRPRRRLECLADGCGSASVAWSNFCPVHCPPREGNAWSQN